MLGSVIAQLWLVATGIVMLRRARVAPDPVTTGPDGLRDAAVLDELQIANHLSGMLLRSLSSCPVRSQMRRSSCGSGRGALSATVRLYG